MRGVRPLACALLLGAASAPAGAQAMRSQQQSITLVAVRRPDFEALDAVRVSTAPAIVPPSGSGLEVASTVEIHDDGPCEIRASDSDAAGRSVSAIGSKGEELELHGVTPVTLFSGECRSAAPAHAFTFVLARTAAVDIELEVVCFHQGQPRRWKVEVPLGLGIH